ncbi:hypothetical protein L3X38_033512 [Prunus dulcis]|uniref:Uncharacterized protein n=1 Tax=Prunus dulcis TaxID=3755 RepID=A0AAD4VHH6_PRUDU|nr:hypothetical protein L3X38_033512 [Prunus dulcis]
MVESNHGGTRWRTSMQSAWVGHRGMSYSEIGSDLEVGRSIKMEYKHAKCSGRSWRNSDPELGHVCKVAIWLIFMSHTPRVQGGQVGPATYDQAYEIGMQHRSARVNHATWRLSTRGARLCMGRTVKHARSDMEVGHASSRVDHFTCGGLLGHAHKVAKLACNMKIDHAKWLLFIHAWYDTKPISLISLVFNKEHVGSIRFSIIWLSYWVVGGAELFLSLSP